MSRYIREMDPSKASVDAQRQATIEKMAMDLGLKVSFEMLPDRIDMTVEGAEDVVKRLQQVRDTFPVGFPADE